MDELRGWFVGRLPGDWYVGEPDVQADRDEVWVVGKVSEPDLPADAGEAAQAAARDARVKRFREQTRDERMQISREVQHRFGVSEVSWGVEIGGQRAMFTTQAVPVMTRLRLPERRVLDTLIEAGVARSRSEAMAWCVKLVGKHESDWIAKLRDALKAVEAARADGPAA